MIIFSEFGPSICPWESDEKWTRRDTVKSLSEVNTATRREVASQPREQEKTAGERQKREAGKKKAGIVDIKGQSN